MILGGLATGDVSTSRIVQVDPQTGQSVVAGRLALAVHDSAGGVAGGRILVFGGGSYSTVSEVQAWTSGDASVVGRLPQDRSDLSAVSTGGTIYVVGGFDGTTMTPDVLATTDGVTFRTFSRLVIGVRYAATAALDGALWIIGGVTSTSEGGTDEIDAIQRVDLRTGATSIVGHMPEAIGHATAVVLGGSLFVLGGRVAGSPSAAIWRIDTADASGTPTATAVPAGHLPQALSDAGSVVVGNRGYVVGGEVTGPADPLDTVVALEAVAP